MEDEIIAVPFIGSAFSFFLDGIVEMTHNSKFTLFKPIEFDTFKTISVMVTTYLPVA